MKLYHGIASFTPPKPGVVLTIGNFDGVHLGHQALVRKARALAVDRGCPAVVLTFEPHPLAVLRPQRAPERLTTEAEKAGLLAQAGADALIVLTADAALLATPAEAFFQTTILRCRPRAMVEGPTFNFGRGRGGSVDSLRELAGRHGFAFHLCDAVRCERLADRPVINSTAVRAALREGQLDRANAMLGRPYRLVGRVVRGDGRGAGLGFPTANLDDVPQMIPKPAVLAAVAQLEDGALYAAAVNVGPQPTFDQSRSRVEAHLLGYRGDLRGQRVGLHLLSVLREPRRFDGRDALAAQIGADVAAVRQRVCQRDLEAFEPVIGLAP